MLWNLKVTKRIQTAVKKRPDFVVSGQDGETSSRGFRDFTNKSLTEKDQEVGINYPYKGAELIKRYGAPWKIVMHYRQKLIGGFIWMKLQY